MATVFLFWGTKGGLGMRVHINYIIEFISLLIAIFYYPYISKSFMRWFLPFLAFIFIMELVAGSLSYYITPKWTNASIYYLVSIIESIFYNFIFYKISHREGIRKIILLFSSISTIAFSFGFIFYTNDYNFYLPILIIFGFSLSTIALSYVYTSFTDDDKMVLITEPGFWIALGVSVFFSGTSIVFSLYNFIRINNLTVFGIKLYNFVPRILCIVLYSSISIAIILCKKKNKISL
jgi:hypothetical protein